MYNLIIVTAVMSLWTGELTAYKQTYFGQYPKDVCIEMSRRYNESEKTKDYNMAYCIELETKKEEEIKDEG